jgi:N-acetylglucosamine-6-phosphate deacetylase
MDTYASFDELHRTVRADTYALGGVIVTPERVLAQGAVIIQEGKVLAVTGDLSEAKKDAGGLLMLPYIIAPGFVDIHIHGGFGVDVYDSLTTPRSLEKLRVELAARGTTSFFLTLYTADSSKMVATAKSIANHAKTSSRGSRIIGVHYEGPFINKSRAGAQDRRFIVEPKPDIADSLVEAVLGEGKSGVLGCVFTMAPEVEGGLDLAKSVSERGVIVSAGHTDADYDQATLGFRSGFTHVTHLYNAMRPFGHRDPGVVGAALDSPDVSVDIIVDSHHVDPRVVKSTVKIKGYQHTAIISDALFPAGLRGAKSVGGLHLEGGVAKLADGTIAGAITLQEGELLVGVKMGSIPLREVVGMLSTTPSKVIHRSDLGDIRVGQSADLVFLDRDTLSVVGSLVGGRQVFANPDYAKPSLTKHLASSMYNEVLEQPSRLGETLKGIKEVCIDIAREFSRKPPRIFYLVGSGSSYHAAVSARFAFKRFTGELSAPVPASEFPSWVGDGEAEGGAMIAVSQSGESTDTVRAAEKAKSMGLPVIGVTNNPDSTISRISNWAITIGAGAERAVTATKSFTCSLLSLYTLAVEVGRESGHLSEDLYYNAKLSLASIPSEVSKCVSECEWRTYTLSEELVSAKAVFTMGSGVTYPVALEASLKLKEAANLYAEGFALREFLHGPMQLLGENTVVVVFEPPAATPDVGEVVDKFRKYGSRVITVSASQDEVADIVAASSVEEEFYPVIATVPAQLLALFSSLRRSLDPDNPSKLSKVVR